MDIGQKDPASLLSLSEMQQRSSFEKKEKVGNAKDRGQRHLFVWERSGVRGDLV